MTTALTHVKITINDTVEIISFPEYTSKGDMITYIHEYLIDASRFDSFSPLDAHYETITEEEYMEIMNRLYS